MNFHLSKKAFLSSLLMMAISTVFAQTNYHAANAKITVDGTSTLHDWKMESSTGECTASIVLDASGHLSALSALSFSLKAESLKSDKSGLDKNAYKSLQTSKYKTITYQLTSATVTPAGAIRCLGKMTIAGVTLDADLVATAKVNPDKSITVKGSKKIGMKTFKIDPPSFMMGAVKTGNDITISFDVTLKN